MNADRKPVVKTCVM